MTEVLRGTGMDDTDDVASVDPDAMQAAGAAPSVLAIAIWQGFLQGAKLCVCACVCVSVALWLKR